MAGKKTATPKREDFASAFPKGVEAERVTKERTRESPADKKHRHRQEFWTFVVWDLAPMGLVLIVLAIACLACLLVIFRPGWLPEERQRAWTLWTGMVTSLVGFAVGRKTKSQD